MLGILREVVLRFLFILLATTLVFGQEWTRVEQALTGSTSSFSSGSGHSWADIDGDGDADLFLNGSQRLWINMAVENQTFASGQSLLPGGLSGSGWAACFGDFDNDGDPDVFCGNTGTDFLLQNNWPADFTSVGPTYQLTDEDWCQSINWVDYNNDGLLDIYITHETPSGDGPHEFYQSDYPNAFIPRFPSGAGPDPFGLADLNSHAYGLTWADIDLDGDIDAVTSACGSSSTIPGENPHNKMYINQFPLDSFADVSLKVGLVTPGEVSAGSASYWAMLFDYDGDAFPDLSIGSTGGDHRLWRNTGVSPGDVGIDLVPNSVHNTAGSGAFVDGAVAGDWDNDGDMDIYTTPNGLYENDGSGSYTLRNDLVPAGGQDASFVDYNLDGHLDVFNFSDLYQNPGNDNHWLAVELEGDPSAGTTRGANNVKIQVTAGGVTQHREHRYQVGSYSQHMLPTHFGLGKADFIDSVRIIWPDTSETLIEDLAPDQYIKITQNADCSGTLSASDTTFFFCADQSFPLSVNSNNAEAIRWHILDGPSRNPGQFDDLTSSTPTFTPDESGIYRLGVTYEGCPQSQVVFNLVDSDYDGNGTYGIGDLMATLEPWSNQDDVDIYDVDGDGTFTVADMLNFCFWDMPMAKAGGPTTAP